MQELGAAFFTGPNGKGDWIGRTATQQFAAPDFSKDQGPRVQRLPEHVRVQHRRANRRGRQSPEDKGLFQSLAEPNLITQDGKEASFLAGGEYPYRRAGQRQREHSVTIVFKEFGVRLRFTPTITADDMIHLKVTPEVSTLDFGNGVVLDGFRVPALATRRTDTEVELRDGQTFAIAGLMNNNVNETLKKIPGIGDIPILGYLFKSQAYTEERDRAGRDDHAAYRAARFARRDAEPAGTGSAISAGSAQASASAGARLYGAVLRAADAGSAEGRLDAGGAAARPVGGRGRGSGRSSTAGGSETGDPDGRSTGRRSRVRGEILERGQGSAPRRNAGRPSCSARRTKSRRGLTPRPKPRAASSRRRQKPNHRDRSRIGHERPPRSRRSEWRNPFRS